MKALITGGTGGIGLSMADSLARRGYDLFLVSRKEGAVDELRKKYPSVQIDFASYDLSDENECYRLLKATSEDDYDVFINNAGFGDIGRLTETDTAKEVKMIKLNDIATVILGKEFLRRFIKKDSGRVLLVASAAAFGPAPYMSVYYSTKTFVYYLAQGYYRELKDYKSHATISVLCPGPVKTDFENKANCHFTIGSLKPEQVGELAVKKMLKGKLTIVPGVKIKLAHTFSHLVPKKFISKVLNKSAEIGKK